MSRSEPTTTRARRGCAATIDRIAGRLAAVGATLGVIAGLIDVAVGASIRDWAGNKLDTTPLGLGTVFLSTIALAAAIQWRRSGRAAGGQRLATALALIVPAAICFTTIGRLWYLSGVLLLLAGIMILATSTRDELAHAITEQRWLSGLTAVLGGYYVFLGADALPKAAGALGILGGLTIWMALLVTRRSHRLALSLIAAGALPFAIATWWSVITPLIAMLAVGVGNAATHPKDARPSAA